MLGVDLGTSHTVAMLRWPDGRVRPLLFDGRPLLPSAVFRDSAGRLHVGHDAVRLGYAEPARLEPHPKRQVDAPTVLLGEAEVPVPELLAALLEAVAREAVAAAGHLPPAVVTCPAAWGETRREVLTRALALAGWPPATQIVPEPVAAARYFAEVLRRPVPVGAALAVFDFGGGTLDIAVVRNGGMAADGRGRFEVVASGGLDDLGGLDIDAALVAHLGMGLAETDPEAWAALREPVTLAQWRARRHFWDEVRGAKEMLSRTAQAPVAVPGLEHAVHLTRDELELVAGPLVRRGVAEAVEVIKAAGLAPADLAGLFLVGGSSRVPMVARLLHSELGVAPTVLEQPELPVAEGALLAATPSTGDATAAATDDNASRPPHVAAEAGRALMQAAAAGPVADTVAHGQHDTDPRTEAAAAPDSPTAAGPGVAGSSAAGLPTPDAARSSLAGPSAPGVAGASAAGPPSPGVSGSPAAGGQAGAGEPEYAEPVDPWATGEAAALAAGHGSHFGLPTSGAPISGAPTSGAPTSPAAAPTAAEPWLASAATSAERTTPGPRLPAYRRKGLWIVAAATVVVLGAAATLVAYFWPGYAALDYQPLSAARPVAPAVPVTSGFSAAGLRDGRAYFASADDNGQLGVVAAAADTGKKLWSSTDAGVADRWEFFFTLPNAVVAITAADSDSRDRRMVFLNPEDGKKMWERRIATNDSMHFAGDIAVLVDRTENRIAGLEVRGQGKIAWEKKNPKSESGQYTTKVVTASTPDDLAGAATTTGVAFAEPMDDDERIVQIGADRSVRVLDAGTGGQVSTRQSVADPETEVIAHNGRLIVAEGGDTRQIVVYDLNKLGQPQVPYTAPDTSHLERLTPCGDDLICFVQTDGYDSKTTQVVAVDVVKGGKKWARPLPEIDGLVPVGDALLAQQNTQPATQVSLLRADGTVAWSRAAAVGRLDGGNILLFSKPLSTSPDDPALTGEHVGDAAVPLGSLTGVRSATCAWDQHHLACVAEKDFVLHTFAA
ncbi:Hsp70 family protein [Actinoplanes sp. NPDC051859]|uniref:Hsp70 family protein n=1 Tax=Actinoplanes sp. NPDC051859 TaxID=3363909 RepID=UPI00379C2021